MNKIMGFIEHLLGWEIEKKPNKTENRLTNRRIPMNKIAVIIPARLASTRFPRKALADIYGKPVIQRVYEAASQAKGIADAFVATPDVELAEVVESFGGKYIMTGPQDTCLGRCSEAMRDDALFDYYGAVIAQGDEPMLKPEMLDVAVEALGKYGVCWLVKKILPHEDPTDINMIKCALNSNGNIIYVSRGAIPIPTPEGDHDFIPTYYKQVGVVAFGRRMLIEFNNLERGPLEKCEGIDLLRFLEHGVIVSSALSPYDTQSLDTPEDLERILDMWPK